MFGSQAVGVIQAYVTDGIGQGTAAAKRRAVNSWMQRGLLTVCFVRKIMQGSQTFISCKQYHCPLADSRFGKGFSLYISCQFEGLFAHFPCPQRSFSLVPNSVMKPV